MYGFFFSSSLRLVVNTKYFRLVGQLFVVGWFFWVLIFLFRSEMLGFEVNIFKLIKIPRKYTVVFEFVNSYICEKCMVGLFLFI